MRVCEDPEGVAFQQGANSGSFVHAIGESCRSVLAHGSAGPYPLYPFFTDQTSGTV